jgi:hypothetical protein
LKKSIAKLDILIKQSLLSQQVQPSSNQMLEDLGNLLGEEEDITCKV